MGAVSTLLVLGMARGWDSNARVRAVQAMVEMGLDIPGMGGGGEVGWTRDRQV